MQTRTSRRAASRSSPTRKSSSSKSASASSARPSRGGSGRGRASRSVRTQRWETPLRRAFFSSAGRLAASMGVSVDACVAHVRALQPDAGFNDSEVDTIRKAVHDLVLVAGCVQDAPQAWSELRREHTWILIEALRTYAPSRDRGLQVERFWCNLQAASVRGQLGPLARGLDSWDPRRPLGLWLTDLLFSQVQLAREFAPSHPAVPVRALESLDMIEEARTLRFPLIAAVQ